MMTWPGCNCKAFGSLSSTTIFDKGRFIFERSFTCVPRMKCVHSLYNLCIAQPSRSNAFTTGSPTPAIFDENITISYFMAMSLKNCSTPGLLAWRQPNLRSQDACTNVSSKSNTNVWGHCVVAVSYTHLTLPTTPYV